MEILQKLSDPPYAHCAKCGGDVKKLQSSPAIQFKGSGFYKTDYASSSSTPASSSSEKSESSSTTSTSTTTETKSDTKSEKKSSD